MTLCFPFRVYKELVAVQRNPSTQNIEVTSAVYLVKGVKAQEGASSREDSVICNSVRPRLMSCHRGGGDGRISALRLNLPRSSPTESAAHRPLLPVCPRTGWSLLPEKKRDARNFCIVSVDQARYIVTVWHHVAQPIW